MATESRGWRLPLALRTWFATAIAIVLATGGIAFAVEHFGRRILDDAATASLAGATAAQERLGRERLRGLEFGAGVIANDPGLAPYLAASIGDDLGLGDAIAPDVASLRDLLSERRQQFVFDLGMLLDARAGVLARSDRGEAFVQNLGGDPLIAAALKSLAAQSGYWQFEDQLFQAAVVPMTQDGSLIGFLLLAQRIDDALSRDLATASGADVAFWKPGERGSKLFASSFPAERIQALAAALAKDPAMRAATTPDATASHAFSLANERLLARGSRVTMAGGGVVAITTLLPESSANGGGRRLLDLLRLAAAIATVFALGLAALLIGWALKPVRLLAQASERAAAGEFELHPSLRGRDPLARLSRAIDELLSRLREKRDIDAYLADVSRSVSAEDTASAARAMRIPAPIASTSVGSADMHATVVHGAAATSSGSSFAQPAAASPTATTVVVPAPTRIGAEPEIGARFGSRYEILSMLGKGGMGTVYKARDLELGDVIALKLLRSGTLEDREQIERLKDEIRLARKITHPNVVRTFDFGEADGRAFITMEYVHGVMVRALLKQSSRLPYSGALRIVRQLVVGLEAAHTVGVLHRDIKPENLIVEAGGNTKLMDFGVARPARRGGEGLTQVGMTVGSPDYSAPEQLTGSDIDERADIYACGVVMCELASGVRPYRGASAVEIYMAQMKQEITRPSQAWPEVPAEFEAIALRCVAIKPEDRFRSAAELGQALARLKA